MPKRRFRRKRRPRKRRRRMARRRRIPILLGRSHACQHRFVHATQLLVDSVAGLSITQTIRLNSASTPLVGSTRQPQGFAQMSQLFAKNTVIGCKMTMTALPSLGQHARAFYISKELVNRFGSPSFELNDILSQRFIRYSVYGPGAGTGWKPRVHMTCSPKKFLGLKDIRDNSEVQAFGDGLPERQIFANFCQAPTHGTPLETCDIIVTCMYTVLYTDPISPANT